MRGAQPWKTNRARVLRDGQSAPEARLWSRLRNHQLGGFKFVRQAPIGPYFADFLCRECKFIIEVDGATHGSDDEIIADRARERDLNMLGYHVLRFKNDDVRMKLDGVLDEIFKTLQNRIEQ